MNPHIRQLRFRKSTVRNLTPDDASRVRGGTIHFDTKTHGYTELAVCTTMATVGCPTDYETCVSCYVACIHGEPDGTGGRSEGCTDTCSEGDACSNPCI